ncbi:MAG: hypothetical protein JWN22_3100, partial [Nocardioides sp.]|nr:hypothetical protein [Nocardioides sp.]
MRLGMTEQAPGYGVTTGPAPALFEPSWGG